jgi:Trk K+ transport system NAD-binding subunit
MGVPELIGKLVEFSAVDRDRAAALVKRIAFGQAAQRQLDGLVMEALTEAGIDADEYLVRVTGGKIVCQPRGEPPQNNGQS